MSYNYRAGMICLLDEDTSLRPMGLTSEDPTFFEAGTPFRILYDDKVRRRNLVGCILQYNYLVVEDAEGKLWDMEPELEDISGGEEVAFPLHSLTEGDIRKLLSEEGGLEASKRYTRNLVSGLSLVSIISLLFACAFVLVIPIVVNYSQTSVGLFPRIVCIACGLWVCKTQVYDKAWAKFEETDSEVPFVEQHFYCNYKENRDLLSRIVNK